MRIGILGGGQLGRMLALAGYPLGLDFTFLDPAADACAAPLGEHLRADYSDPTALARLCAHAQVATYEFENVPLAVAERVAARLPLRPGPAALRAGQDRLSEKTLFRELGIDVAPFAPVSQPQDFVAAVETAGLPALLKTRRLGYDGKGQALVRTADDLATAWENLGRQPAILETLVRFDRELSCIAVRDEHGDIRFYPVTENRHRDGILRSSRPRPGNPLQPLAEDYTRRLLERLDYVGVLAFEFFAVGERLLANEIAPRVHNSGHWSIDGAQVSQFENHLRAVVGLPLGDTAPRGVCVMLNCIGDMPDLARLSAVPGAHPHAYGKKPKPGRKLGHVTVTAEDEAVLQQRLRMLREAVPELAAEIG